MGDDERGKVLRRAIEGVRDTFKDIIILDKLALFPQVYIVIAGNSEFNDSDFVFGVMDHDNIRCEVSWCHSWKHLGEGFLNVIAPALRTEVVVVVDVCFETIDECGMPIPGVTDKASP